MSYRVTLMYTATMTTTAGALLEKETICRFLCQTPAYPAFAASLSSLYYALIREHILSGRECLAYRSLTFSRSPERTTTPQSPLVSNERVLPPAKASAGAAWKRSSPAKDMRANGCISESVVAGELSTTIRLPLAVSVKV